MYIITSNILCLASTIYSQCNKQKRKRKIGVSTLERAMQRSALSEFIAWIGFFTSDMDQIYEKNYDNMFLFFKL